MLDAGKPDDTQQGSSINTGVIDDTSSPEAAVDNVDSINESESKSDQSSKLSDSEDQQDLKDEISINDVVMRKEFDKTIPATNSEADESSGGDTFTKRFQENDLSCLKFAERRQIRLPFLQTCPEALDT